MDDLITEVNEKNEVIGLRLRKDFYGGKIIHRGVQLILLNSKKEMAIMKRSMNKKWYPGLYTYSVSGTVEDETTDECIKRETKEEIGIEVSFNNLFTFRHSDNFNSAFATIYSAVSDLELTPDPQEISQVDWVTLDWLKNDMVNHPSKYTYTFLEGMKIYFEKYNI